MSDYLYVDSADALAPALERWSGSPWLAVDTEFIREETYYPRLCLVQVGNGEAAWCVDALAIIDLQPLFAQLASARVVKLFHAASQDLEIFVHRHGACPAPLFDTQIAAALLGFGDQLGYAGLVEKRLGVVLDKSLSRTDWARRPLQPAELAYAAADVLYLGAMYAPLRAALAERGRLEWLEEECERLGRTERYRPHPELEWRRLKGLARLSADAQHSAAALAAWRERQAEARDRPRKWILADEQLYALADRRPGSIGQLQALGLPPRSVERHGDTLLRVIEEAPRGLPALVRDERLDDAEKTLMTRLQQELRRVAEELGVPPALLAPRAELEALVWQGAAAPLTVLTGWRRAVVGEALLALLPR